MLALRLNELDIPDSLQGAVASHQANVAKLVDQLRSVGMSDVAIEDAVGRIVDDYKSELFLVIKALRDNNHELG